MRTGKQIYGFTLYEMLVVIIVIAIMLSLALPLVVHQLLLRSNEETTLQLQAVFKTAQEEALHRNATIIICSANYNVNDYLYNCMGNNDWSDGVLAYIDLDNAGGYDSSERIHSLQFTQGVVVSAAESALYVDSNGQFFDSTGNDNWTFNLSQSRMGVSVETKEARKNNCSLSA